MKIYCNYTVYFDDGKASPVLVRASSMASACEVAIDYINGSISRLYTGKPSVSPQDILKVTEEDFEVEP